MIARGKVENIPQKSVNFFYFAVTVEKEKMNENVISIRSEL